jgi:hypothetical protein
MKNFSKSCEFSIKIKKEKKNYQTSETLAKKNTFIKNYTIKIFEKVKNFGLLEYRPRRYFREKTVDDY